jgi:hypothetical protein
MKCERKGNFSDDGPQNERSFQAGPPDAIPARRRSDGAFSPVIKVMGQRSAVRLGSAGTALTAQEMIAVLLASDGDSVTKRATQNLLVQRFCAARGGAVTQL